MKCPVDGCPLGLVRVEGLHLSPICPAHGSPETRVLPPAEGRS